MWMISEIRFKSFFARSNCLVHNILYQFVYLSLKNGLSDAFVGSNSFYPHDTMEISLFFAFFGSLLFVESSATGAAGISNKEPSASFVNTHLKFLNNTCTWSLFGNAVSSNTQAPGTNDELCCNFVISKLFECGYRIIVFNVTNVNSW